jgi:hypothetical protein
VIQNRDKDIRTTLNNKGKDVIKTDKYRWPQTLKGFADIGIGNRS